MILTLLKGIIKKAGKFISCFLNPSIYQLLLLYHHFHRIGKFQFIAGALICANGCVAFT